MRLSGSDIRRLNAAQQLLLSPLDYETREAWWIASMRAVKEAVRCDIASFALSSPSGVVGATEDFDRSLFGVFERFDQDDLHHIHAVRRALAGGTPVFLASEALRRHCGRQLEDTRIYQEFMHPAGVRDGPVLAAGDGGTAVTMGLARAGWKVVGRGYDRERALLALLAPCLAVGLRLIASVGREADGLVALLDRPGNAFAILDPDGRELHRNRRFAELLEADPERDRVLEVAARLRARRDAADDLSTERTVLVSTAHASYEVSVVSCAPPSFGHRPVVVVFLRRPGLSLPPAQKLHQQWGLSVREAEVALLLARGASNKAIGRALGIRPATVRTHAEHVFAKLGVHSRKALALSLIGD